MNDNLFNNINIKNINIQGYFNIENHCIGFEDKAGGLDFNFGYRKKWIMN